MQILLDDDELLKFIGLQESQYIEPASSYAAQVLARLGGQQERGDPLPWSKAQGRVALRPSEVSIWAGVNGHGKSMLLGQVCAWNLAKRRWLIASMEMKPAATMARMVRQIAGARNPTESYTTDFLRWTDGRLWIYDQTDSVKTERIVGMLRYAAQVLRIEHIVIDSLMKCGIGTDDYNGQKTFVDRLCWIAKTENIHIHLVHHIRKGGTENAVPDKFDIRGASEITDLVDNVFIIHRNKTKESMIENGAEVDKEIPDAYLKVAKQRHGEWEGHFKLWYHADSQQFIPGSDNRAMCFDFA